MSGNPDINLERTKDNIYYVQRDIRDVYSENFDQAVQDYNNKQKRSDRKIDDYYSKILQDKKTHHQRELIVAIGSKDDLSYGYSDERYKQVKEEILDKYMRDFEKRNPNLKVYNAVMHLDEANPHLHINYVPVYEAKRGLSRRVGQDKALEQQGFKNFEEWRERETNVVEEFLKENRIKRDFKDAGEHLGVREYKTIREDIKRLESEKNTLKSEVYDMRKAIQEFEEFEIPHKTSFLGEVKMSSQDFMEFNELVKTAKSYDLKFYKLEEKERELKDRELKTNEKENELRKRELSDPVRPHLTKAALLEKENEKLTREKQDLNKKIEEQKKEIEYKESLLKDSYLFMKASSCTLDKLLTENPELNKNIELRALVDTIKLEAKSKMIDIFADVTKRTIGQAKAIVTNSIEKFDEAYGAFKDTFAFRKQRLKTKTKQRAKTQDRGMER